MILRGNRDSVRDSAVAGLTLPKTAATHAILAIPGSCGIALQARFIVPMPIRAPFHDIARHIIQPKFIGGLTANRMSRLIKIITPGYVIDTVTASIFIATTLDATSRGKFPFSLGGKPELDARHGIEFLDEQLVTSYLQM